MKQVWGASSIVLAAKTALEPEVFRAMGRKLWFFYCLSSKRGNQTGNNNNKKKTLKAIMRNPNGWKSKTWPVILYSQLFQEKEIEAGLRHLTDLLMRVEKQKVRKGN